MRERHDHATLGLDTLPGLVAVPVLAAVAAAEGGYWPTTWGWTSVTLVWLLVLALLVTRRVELSALECGFAAAFVAFAGWAGASFVWTRSVPSTVSELQRVMLYVIAVAAVAVVARRTTYRVLLAAVWAAVTLIGIYSVATRLFPQRLGSVDALAGNRLSEPLGYWNALGIYTTLGIVIGFALAARARGPWVRFTAAASLPILAAVQYFTFSRGAWLAVAAALVATFAIDPRRLQLLALLLPCAVLPAVGVAFASQSDALTQSAPVPADASREGLVLGTVLVTFAIANGAIALALGFVAPRVDVPARVRRAFGVALVGLVVVGLIATFIRFGDPVTLAEDAYGSLGRDPPADADLNRRLFALGSPGRIHHWHVAWDTFAAAPLAGTGGGTYEQAWLIKRDIDMKVRNAHSLYLETMAELGIIGILLLATALTLPLVAAIKARHRGLVPAGFGAYVAYLAHAAIDWDWEFPAVTLAALVAGGAVLAAARGEPTLTLRGGRRYATAMAFVVLGAGAFIGLKSNLALADSVEAFRVADFTRSSAAAREAARWGPWSSQPWQRLGQAALAQGKFAEARWAFRKGIAKDPHNWELWIGLASADQGPEGDRALARAAELNPQLVGH
jgi:hypothetical protein